ncbi:ABC transporter permease [Flaviaesturariibacter aridisoli]|uniref:ABC transporter permease n=1 Tax=Flaviaesturariibacter aridisoli TaxID=2545761 RepID=A0A4V2WN11_9BACT|nr:ABC transporter permease [Flaviaesturariibacter aridisoli]TCZ73712.1 ABC transporter permease [Flaviaesturariibacter aridisoli]
MRLFDIYALASRTVRGNKLRTGITVTIIALGIMALIFIITCIQAMSQKFTESFSTMGANGFTLRFKERNIQFGGGNNNNMKVSKKGARREKKSSLGKPITEEQAEAFARGYHFPASVGLSTFASRNAIINNGTRKTTPNVFLFGADENYTALNGFTLHSGRNFGRQEVQGAQNVCLLGHDVAQRLFKPRMESAVGRVVRINGIPFRVVGILGSRGSSFGFSRDNIVIVSYKSVRRYFDPNGSFAIGVLVNDLHQVEEAMGEAESVFRAVRRLNTTEESNFVIDRSDSVAEKAMNSLGFLTISATVIGLITLIGAAIGLMNIMLVAVTERTKEVGLVKAIGGKSRTVRLQFLFESMIISVLGALFGIVLGILLGNVVALAMGTGFVVPWNWVIIGIVICTAVGLLAGLYPALKAGRLNPIQALRYE